MANVSVAEISAGIGAGEMFLPLHDELQPWLKYWLRSLQNEKNVISMRDYVSGSMHDCVPGPISLKKLRDFLRSSK